MNVPPTDPNGVVAVVPKPSFFSSMFGHHRTPPPKLQANVSFVSDIGCVRGNNEDSFGYFSPDAPTLVAVVADGMGGHACGEVASKMAVDLILREFKHTPKHVGATLTKALHRANAEIFRAARKDPAKSSMGTTVTAIAIVGKLLHLAHVGDSRLYLARGGKAYQLSQDHTQVREWVDAGVLDPEDAKRHPDRNVLTRAVGTKPHVEVEHWSEPMELKSGDALVLCSDGLHDLVNEDEIAAIVTDAKSSSCDKLIELAKSRGAPDNVTAGVIQILTDKVGETQEVSV